MNAIEDWKAWRFVEVNTQSPASRIVALGASFLAGVILCWLFLAAPKSGKAPPVLLKPGGGGGKAGGSGVATLAITGLQSATADANWTHDTVFNFAMAFDTTANLNAYQGSNLGYAAYYSFNATGTLATPSTPNVDQIRWEMIDAKVNGTTLNLRFRAICPYTRDHFNHRAKRKATDQGTGSIIVISTSGTSGNTTDSVVAPAQQTNEQ